MTTQLNRRKSDVLADFLVLHTEHFKESPSPEQVAFMAKLVSEGLCEITIAPLTAYESGTIYILGEITEEIVCENSGTIDQLFAYHLNTPIEKPLTLFISSPGGDVCAGLAVMSTINRIRADGRQVIGHVAGWAMSMAFFILQNCDVRRMEPTAFLMLHEEQFGTEGSTSKHRNETEFSEKECKLLYGPLSQRTGKPVSFYTAKTKNHDWYVSPEEAVVEGMIDEIVAVPSLPSSPAAPQVARTRKPRERKAAASKGVVAITEGSEIAPSAPASPAASADG